jgi:HSP20 family protein
MNTSHAGRAVPADLRQVSDQLFQQNDLQTSTASGAHWAPRVDTREHDQRFLIEAGIPGVEPVQIEVGMLKCRLSIEGERPSGQTELAARS